jgi:large subunit ribosomal protein L3
MGCERVAVQKLRVVRVQEQENLLLVRGAVPGRNGGYVTITKA